MISAASSSALRLTSIRVYAEWVILTGMEAKRSAWLEAAGIMHDFKECYGRNRKWKPKGARMYDGMAWMPIRRAFWPQSAPKQEMRLLKVVAKVTGFSK